MVNSIIVWIGIFTTIEARMLEVAVDMQREARELFLPERQLVGSNNNLRGLENSGSTKHTNDCVNDDCHCRGHLCVRQP